MSTLYILKELRFELAKGLTYAAMSIAQLTPHQVLTEVGKAHSAPDCTVVSNLPIEQIYGIAQFMNVEITQVAEDSVPSLQYEDVLMVPPALGVSPDYVAWLHMVIKD